MANKTVSGWMVLDPDGAPINGTLDTTRSGSIKRGEFGNAAWGDLQSRGYRVAKVSIAFDDGGNDDE